MSPLWPGSMVTVMPLSSPGAVGAKTVKGTVAGGEVGGVVVFGGNADGVVVLRGNVDGVVSAGGEVDSEAVVGTADGLTGPREPDLAEPPH